MQIITPYSQGGEIPDSFHRALWLAVIKLAVEEAEGEITSIGGRGPSNPTVHRCARAWLAGGSSDLRFVCMLAGIEPSWAVREFQERFGDHVKVGRLRKRKKIKLTLARTIRKGGLHGTGSDGDNNHGEEGDIERAAIEDEGSAE